MVFNHWTRLRSRTGWAGGSRLFWRTTVPMVAVGIVLLSVGIVSAWRVHQMHQRSDRIVSENVSSIREAKELETLFHQFRYRLKRFLRAGNERHLEELAPLIPECRERLARTIAFGQSSSEQDSVERLARGGEALLEDFERLVQSSGEDRTRLAARMADQLIAEELLGATRDYVLQNEQKLSESNQRNQSTASLLMLGLIALGTCGAVGGLLAGYGLSRVLNRTIVQLAIPIRDTAGKLDEVVGPISVSTASGFEDLQEILRTVSARVATVVERLQDSERELIRGEQLAAVGQLAAGIAHELRNPLTAVKPILQLAQSPQDLTDRDLEVLRAEVGRLEASIQTLLDFARPSKPAKREISLERLLEDTVQLVARRAERQDVRLTLRPTRDPMTVLVDMMQLRQVILNLLLNALEAVQRGGHVTIETEFRREVVPPDAPEFAGVDPTAADWAVIHVRDSGRGIEDSVADQLFDPFVSTKETGTGLGLSICKRVLDAHGGAIVARNAPAAGAVFSVWLPLTGAHPSGRETWRRDDSSHQNSIGRFDHADSAARG
jgi:two-component system, NtrC family, sensor histidine kinase HydH